MPEPTKTAKAIGNVIGAVLVLAVVAVLAAPVVHSLVAEWRWAVS